MSNRYKNTDQPKKCVSWRSTQLSFFGILSILRITIKELFYWSVTSSHLWSKIRNALSNCWYKSSMPKYLTQIFKIVTRKKLLKGLLIDLAIRVSTPGDEHIFVFTDTQRAMRSIQPSNQSVSNGVFLRIKHEAKYLFRNGAVVSRLVQIMISLCLKPTD